MWAEKERHSNGALKTTARERRSGDDPRTTGRACKNRGPWGVSPLDEAGCARPVRAGVACPAFPRVEGVTEARERQQRGEPDVRAAGGGGSGSGSGEDLWRADFQPRTAVRAQMVLLVPALERERNALRARLADATSLLSPMGNRKTRRLN